ncbi:hypothetical protein DACRYDRAFT_108867 [Dacryopinax primogenitus]|uniref:Uncharacterized protein n=1 Tax=Dacryopinax primogenitus (strain DJM 731) TaxID=1858805 RepID=M5FWP4_DACPD|nr:uncharacterized protein DACRYDRAFT_108867 [Dacryopinax primogenitus]EJU00814.1 hypothetical protein DACRYDRAFT_108867 [Dacryopinax primogenitus]
MHLDKKFELEEVDGVVGGGGVEEEEELVVVVDEKEEDQEELDKSPIQRTLRVLAEFTTSRADIRVIALHSSYLLPRFPYVFHCSSRPLASDPVPPPLPMEVPRDEVEAQDYRTFSSTTLGLESRRNETCFMNAQLFALLQVEKDGAKSRMGTERPIILDPVVLVFRATVWANTHRLGSESVKTRSDAVDV